MNAPLGAMPLARPTDPATSHAAGRKADKCESQRQVDAALSAFGPLTDEQIEGNVAIFRKAAQLKPFTGSRLRTARRELMDMDLPKVRVAGTTTNSRNRTVQIFERT